MSAVVMRSAPGLPIASADPADDPPDDRATEGAMLEASRVPGASACRPSRFSSGSPRQLLSMSPVPGTVAPEPYPLDAVIAQTVPSLSTAETCAVDEEVGRPASPLRSIDSSRA